MNLIVDMILTTKIVKIFNVLVCTPRCGVELMKKHKSLTCPQQKNMSITVKPLHNTGEGQARDNIMHSEKLEIQSLHKNLITFLVAELKYTIA